MLTSRLGFRPLWLLIAGGLGIWAPPAAAGDWPQILGPQRNGVSPERVSAWASSGPRKQWSAAIGAGYSGPVVAEGKVVIFHRQGDRELLTALDEKTGKSLWQAEYPASYGGGVNDDNGPRATPACDRGMVFAFGAAGDLYCVSLADGKRVWDRALYVDYKGDEGYFGAGCSPLVIGELVLLNGGGKGAGIVAVDRATGKTVWAATDEIASYSSAAAATLEGKPCAVFVTRLNVVGLNPADGEVKFRIPFGKKGPTVNAAVPLISGETLFVTANYNVGAVCGKMTTGGVDKLWAGDGILSSQYNTPVIRDGYLYGIHGREDAGRAALRCVELATGKVAWEEKEFGCAHAILAGDKLLLLKTNGELVLAEAQRESFRSLATAKVSSSLTRAIPALSGGRLFVRDLTQGRGEVTCWEIPAGK